MTTKKKDKKGKTVGRQKTGTHGSLTKAGKVRDQTPQIEITVPRKKEGPRTKNRKKYVKLLEAEKNKGYSRRRRRRR